MLCIWTDFPIDCDDAKFNTLYKVKEDGPQIIDIDGPDGPTNPVLVHCDMESYPHVGITVIPHDKWVIAIPCKLPCSINYLMDDFYDNMFDASIEISIENMY